MLAQILTRLAGVEEAVGSVSAGITNIMTELHVMMRLPSKDDRVQSPSRTVRLQADSVKIGASNPSDCRQRESHCNVRDTAPPVQTAHTHYKQRTPQHVLPLSAGLNPPILVDLDNMSDHSGSNTGAVECRNRTPESNARRVHSQPRLRVVPCAKNLLGVAGQAAHDEGGAGATTFPIPKEHRYKDPPGYDDVRDFGVSDEPQFKPPALQPKTHGVRQHSTLCMNICYRFQASFEVISNQALIFFLECRPPSALAHAVGCCTRVSTCRLWARRTKLFCER